MAVRTHPKRATLPLPGGREGAGVTVTPMRTADILSPPRFFQRPSGPLPLLRGLGLMTPRSRWIWVPIPCFLVEHPEVGPFLIDTGMGPAAAHYAHTGAVAQLPRSTFVVDAKEWEAAADGGFLQGYRRALFDHGYEWRTLDFDAPQVESFASFGRTIDLFGDGSVRLLSTPGHTKGHMSVLLRLRSGRELLLAADAAYSRRTIAEELLPTFCEDPHRYMRSLREIRRYLELTPSALVICGHDPDSWPQVRDR